MKRAFFDTNILVYTDDAGAPAKQKRAIELVSSYQRAAAAVVSLQVMQEYFVTITGKLGVDRELAQRKVALLARGPVVRFGADDVIAAIELHRLTRISFWDAMIVHAARLAGTEILYSEHLGDGAVIAGVQIKNPFKTM